MLRMRVAAICLVGTLAASRPIVVMAAENPQDSCAASTEVRLARGAASTVLDGVATRSAPHCYVVAARAGQRFTAKLTGDSSDNAALLVFRPGWGFQDLQGYQVMDGTALPGAGRDDEANSVTARLPDTGRYLVEIATARGDAASYGLRLTVR